jgi:anti-sigma factor RsiW
VGGRIKVTVTTIKHTMVGSCEETADHMSEFLDGELDGPLRGRVRRHLFVCKVCRPIFASLKRAVAAVRGQQALVADPDPALVDDVMACIRELPPRGPD